MRLEEKVTIITGASGGIGSFTSKKLLEEGSKVVLVGRNKDKLRKILDELDKNFNDNNILSITADVSHESEVLNVVEQAISAFNKIDILINCAATINDPASFHLMSEDLWNDLINVNLKGTFQPIKAVIPTMIDQNSGNIINISSILGMRAIPNVPFSVYGVTKAGVIMFTKSIAVEYGQYGIRCNCIAPSTIRSPIVEPYLQDDQARKILEASFPLQNIGEPEDISGAVSYLCSKDARWITGTVITVDGGISARQ